ncbi:hypothetical protein SteCoe_13445 [Stentor coeruleus]|uniref:Uncharacterized protein n=1 Tax=Stentor coeruleus TaxID=5963 RepID=A0A1R2C8F7_9CILI|nr:hypothetical protein SteCoe_13445 [Stentor coeruleus]
MSALTGFATKNLENYYNNLCVNLIVHLSQRVVKAMKGEESDDFEFCRTIVNIHKKLVEIEVNKYISQRASEGANDLIGYCKKNFPLRSNSNDNQTQKRGTPERSITSKTPNQPFLDRIIEENYQNDRYNKKTKSNKKQATKFDASSHPYYESMMGKYLKMALKSPIKNNAPKKNPNFQTHHIPSNDGMLFRLF